MSMLKTLPWMLVAILLVVLLVSCGDATVDSTGTTVAGTVVDADGSTVGNAIVEAITPADVVLAADTTTETGEFLLAGLPSSLNDLRLRITHSSYKPLVTDLQQAVNGAAGAGLVLSLVNDDSCCARIVVTVSDTSTSSPIRGAAVKLRSGMTTLKTGETDSNGRVTFNGVCADDYNLHISKSGYRVAELDGIDIEGCDTAAFSVGLSAITTGGDDTCCRGVITIVPTDSATGNAIVGAQVKLTKSGTSPRIKESTSGGARFAEVCEGRYEVRIAKSGYPVVEFAVEIDCNDTMEISRRIAANPANNDTCCDGVAEIVVKNGSSGAVVPGALVKLYRGSTLVRSVEANSNGVARFGDLCSGNYGVSIIKSGYEHHEFGFEIGCNQAIERVRELTPTGSGDSCCTAILKVRVKDATTADWLSGVTVVVKKNGTPIADGTTNGDGFFIEDGLCGYTDYVIVLSKSGYETRTVEWTFEACRTYQETFTLTPR